MGTPFGGGVDSRNWLGAISLQSTKQCPLFWGIGSPEAHWRFPPGERHLSNRGVPSVRWRQFPDWGALLGSGSQGGPGEEGRGRMLTRVGGRGGGGGEPENDRKGSKVACNSTCYPGLPVSGAQRLRPRVPGSPSCMSQAGPVSWGQRSGCVQAEGRALVPPASHRVALACQGPCTRSFPCSSLCLLPLHRSWAKSHRPPCL